MLPMNSTDDGEFYFKNTEYASFSYGRWKFIFVWVSFAVCVALFLHSAAINKKRYHIIRFFTELSLLYSILVCILIDVVGRNPASVRINKICRRLFIYGILGCTVQVIDNYFVYILYVGTHKNLLTWKKYLIQGYIWATCASCILFPTIMPCFLSYSRVSVYELIFGAYCWSAMYLSYNLYFGNIIWVQIRERYSNRFRLREFYTPNASRILQLSYRNIFHLILT